MGRREKTKAQRKDRILRLLRQEKALTVAELVELTHFHERTVRNYLRELEDEYLASRDGLTWYPLNNPAATLAPISLAPEEAVTLYLATRLLVKQVDKRNEAAENALVKLADVLTAEVGVGDEIRQAAAELARRPDDGNYRQVFRPVVEGYLYHRALDITYKPRHGRSFSTLFYPYLIEPSAIGYTTYVIGWSSIVDDLRTYKLERIQQATTTDDTYTIPEDFPGLDILRNSWSIMLGEELVDVVLRFHPDVVDRVYETRWHPSEIKEPDPEKAGWLRWTAQLTDTLDFTPWVRGWGADVEVLAPEDLRRQMVGEARAQAQLYGWSVREAHDEDGSDHSRFNAIFGG